jgi:pimeloyl-ACP methyl ester carboxylesterase
VWQILNNYNIITNTRRYPIMEKVTSKDGTQIAYDKTGNGPVVIIVNGALGYREFYGNKDLAEKLSKEFTVIIYDRRGRGESTDTLPYDVKREIEDIEALIDATTDQAFLYGVSSGAVLSLKAAAHLGNKISKLALYEPPLRTGDTKEFAKYTQHMNELLAAGKRSDAVALFMSNGMTPEELENFRKTHEKEWKIREAVASTLAYENAILGDGLPPIQDAKAVKIPVLVMNGEKGIPFIHEAIEIITNAFPNAQRKTVEGQTHVPSAAAMAPALMKFFKGKEVLIH